MNMAIECDEWSCVSQLMCSNYMHVSIMQWQWNINFTMKDEHIANVFRIPMLQFDIWIWLCNIIIAWNVVGL